jgi:hypothetical protein
VPAVVFIVLAFIAAAIYIAVHRRRGEGDSVSVAEALLLFMLVIPVGIGSIFAALYQLFDSQFIADSIGWKNSPFLREVAFANLGVGIAGVLCWWLRGQFWAAVTLIVSVFSLGAAYGHIAEIVNHNNHHTDNSGPILYTDIIIPVLLLGLLAARYAGRNRHAAMKNDSSARTAGARR